MNTMHTAASGSSQSREPFLARARSAVFLSGAGAMGAIG